MSQTFIRFVCLISLCAFIVRSKSIGYDSNMTDIGELKDVVKELTSKVLKLDETIKNDKVSRVMFYAVIHNKHQTHNKHAILKFDKVIINKGGHYDKYDGVFVAPIKGVYLFSWTATSQTAKIFVTELIVEEKVISTAGQNTGSSGYFSGSMTALCKMEKGDHAWIQTTTATSDHQIHSYDGQAQTSFLGLLIEKEYSAVTKWKKASRFRV